MMRPPRGDWLFIIRNASCVQRKTAVRLMSTTVFHCSTVRSSSGSGGAPVPALLKSRSSRPKALRVAAKSALTAAGSVASVGTASALAASLPAAERVASSASARRPARATCQPASSRASAEARPMPLPAPVTMATLLFIDATPGRSGPTSCIRRGRRCALFGEAAAEGEPEARVDHGRVEEDQGRRDVGRLLRPGQGDEQAQQQREDEAEADPDEAVD